MNVVIASIILDDIGSSRISRAMEGYSTTPGISAIVRGATVKDKDPIALIRQELAVEQAAGRNAAEEAHRQGPGILSDPGLTS